MIQPKPVTLERDGIRLEPLSPEHYDGLVAAASDGNLWELWFTSVPEPGAVLTYIRDAVRGQSDGHMLPWAVRDLKTNTIVGSTRYHDIVAGDRSRRDRLHVVRGALPAHQRQHHLQAAAARACVRDARLRRGRPADRQLQLPIAEGDRGARREEGRRVTASSGTTRRHRPRLGDVFDSEGGVARREKASGAAPSTQRAI